MSEKPTSFSIQINQQSCTVNAQQTVASALALHAQGQTRCSPTGQQRAPLCGMGVCQECRVSINGQPHQLACQTYCQPGMQVSNQNLALPNVQTQPRPNKQAFDVVVVGAGPGGQAAALAAARHGRRVALVDDNPLPGGQIWRAAQYSLGQSPEALQSWAQVSAQSKITWLAAHKVVQVAAERGLVLQTADGNSLFLHYQELILATGARERLLPFPGWTLPGVTGLGGLQALAKGGYPLQGKRVVLAGTGPLLLAVAATLRQRGAQVLCILEQTSRAQLWRFASGLWATPRKLWQAAGLGGQLLGIPYHSNSYVVAALPTADGQQLGAVRLQIGSKQLEMECDYVACAYGLLPNTRLAQALGCALQTEAHADVVAVDQQQATSQAHIWCVGEACGIGGVDKARVEGEIAGLAACGQNTQHLQAERQRWQNFAARLAHAFALRAEIKQLATPETIICRCEDVSFAQITPFSDWRSAKLQTRCGMGACQGLVCGSALRTLRGWQVDGLRAPFSPCRIASFLDEA